VLSINDELASRKSVTLLGVSTQLHVTWRAQAERCEPDYSIVLEGLAAVSLGVERLIEQHGSNTHPIDLKKLVRARALVERATELLLTDLRSRNLA
jgi:hypothetical protein